MLASVVIDNHKYAEFVAAAIESVLQQSYPQIQVVVVDDGSTDHSRSGIDRYADRITRVDKAQGGQASAINAGVAHSRGEVVFIFDADDVLYPDIVERVMRAFADEQDVAWVQFRLEVIDAVGLTAGALKPPECLPRRTGDLRRAITAFPFDIVRMATSGNAFARAALQQMLPIPEHIYRPSGDDWYLCPLGRAVRAGRVPVRARRRVPGPRRQRGLVRASTVPAAAEWDSARSGLLPRERGRRPSICPAARPGVPG